MTEVEMRYRKAKEKDAQDNIEYLDLNPDLIEARKKCEPLAALSPRTPWHHHQGTARGQSHGGQ